MPKQGDFLASNKFLFEVGGAQKTFDQIANLPDSYLAIDNVEVGMATESLCGSSAACIKACSTNSETALSGDFGKPVEILRNFETWPIEAATKPPRLHKIHAPESGSTRLQSPAQLKQPSWTFKA